MNDETGVQQKDNLLPTEKGVKRFKLNAVINSIMKYKHAGACEMNKTMWIEITYNLREGKSDKGTI
jgi:hypothetical protein